MKNTIINTTNLHGITLNKPRIWSTRIRFGDKFVNIFTDSFYTIPFLIEDINDKL